MAELLVTSLWLVIVYAPSNPSAQPGSYQSVLISLLRTGQPGTYSLLRTGDLQDSLGHIRVS